MHAHAEVDKHGHDLLRVEASAESKLADRSPLAVEPQPVRFLVPEKLVIHIVESVGSEYRGHGVLYLGVPHPGTCADLDLVHQVQAFLVVNAGDLHTGDKHFPKPDVIGRVIVEDSPVGSNDSLYRIQLGGHGEGGLVAPVDDRVDAPVVKAEHIELVQVRLDVDIRDVDVGLE